MNKNIYYLFTAISFALLAAAPGRFAFGIFICVELFFLIFTGLLFSFISKKLHLEELNSIITVIGLVFSTVLYKQIVMCFFPLIALQLSFVFYLPTVSSYMIGIVYNNIASSTKVSVIDNMKVSGIFSLLAILVYSLRDIFGFGTFTLPVPSGIKEIFIFDAESFSWSTIFASIPGALVMISVAILLYIYIQNKFKIIERAGGSDVTE